MGVIALERMRKPTTSQQRMALGRQALQVAALISAQLPDNREDAQIVLDHAVRIVRDWLGADAGSGSPGGSPAGGGLHGLGDDGGQ